MLRWMKIFTRWIGTIAFTLFEKRKKKNQSDIFNIDNQMIILRKSRYEKKKEMPTETLVNDGLILLLLIVHFFFHKM